MTATRNPDPAEILAAAEDERHTLLARDAEEHLSREEAELRRYREDIRRIEGVFSLRIQGVSQVPGWITDRRKEDIREALCLLDGLDQLGKGMLIAKADLDTTPAGLRLALSVAESETDSARAYPAWQAAQAFLSAAARR
jgi:hypothetical protein